MPVTPSRIIEIVHPIVEMRSALRRAPHITYILFIATAAFLLVTPSADSQPAPPNGPYPNPARLHVLTNARIIVAPGHIIENAHVVIRDGVIERVGTDVAIPKGARQWDCSERTVHAGFIDASLNIGIPNDALNSNAATDHWNPRVHPEIRAEALPGPSNADREELRAFGFTAALYCPDKGIFRGTAACVSLADRSARPNVYTNTGPQVVAFETGGWNSDAYPGSLMGAIALVRQTLLDADWYRTCQNIYANHPTGLEPPDASTALEALTSVLPAEGLGMQQPVLIHTRDELDALRAARLRDEFDLQVMIVGSGSEFRRLNEVVTADMPIVLPIDFAETPAVTSPDDADSYSLRELMQWEQEPTNPRRLINAGVVVALTTLGSDDTDRFHENLQACMREGLTEDQALAALTTTPASMLGVSETMGTIEAGKIANLVVIDGTGDLFDEDRTVRSVWIDGDRYEIEGETEVDPRGDWQMIVTKQRSPFSIDAPVQLRISGSIQKPRAKLIIGEPDADESEEFKVRSLRVQRELVSGAVDSSVLDGTGWDRFRTQIDEDTMRGQWIRADGISFDFKAQRTGSEFIDEESDDQGNEDGDDEDHEIAVAPEEFPIPLGGFGRLEPAFAPDVIFIHDATLWTGAEDRAIIENGDVIIRDRQIAEIGTDLVVPDGAFVIDGTGKHVTAGLVDCHSHTGISRGSINEGTQAITSEVRIQDVINPDDIDWYRQLAGGLTAANQLHGSANPIGGQNSVVKLRWGGGPDAFRFENATSGIKFALGENVKQSNWGERYTTRYPQTRMGVEQIMRSAFHAAQDYGEAIDRYRQLSEAAKREQYPPQPDLELEALLEILRGERLVHCHSYRQDEILMLIRLADDFGFTIGTFQHILEGYKVASELAEHGAGASAFSDWWAYKFEVYDAIPHAGSIMHEVGVLTSFNSDSDELARRMNLEGAKAVKYGGVPPDQAFNFVALNAAKQLRIDGRVGSIEIGKDADFVVWSGNPLSTYTRCEQTWIEGMRMFSLEEDAQLREFAASERTRIIQKILAANLGASDEKNGDDEDGEDAEGDDPGNEELVDDPDGLTRSHWFRMSAIEFERRYEWHEHSLPGECGCMFPFGHDHGADHQEVER